MKINGKFIYLEKDIALVDFLNKNGYNISRVAVEKNGVIVPKASFETETLSDDDTIEVVSFVGGG